MRVSPEKQTLFLAGELVPRRGLANADARAQRPLTMVATPADETMLLVQDGAESAGSEVIMIPRKLSSSPSAADAYLRTQESSYPRTRTSIIDTYA